MTMRENQRKAFNLRAFVSLTAAMSGLGLPLTGLANHWVGFDALTRERHAWMAAHNVLGTLFVVSAGWHVGLNYRALVGYAKAKARANREVFWALGLVAVMLLLAVGHEFHVH